MRREIGRRGYFSSSGIEGETAVVVEASKVVEKRKRKRERERAIKMDLHKRSTPEKRLGDRNCPLRDITLSSGRSGEHCSSGNGSVLMAVAP